MDTESGSDHDIWVQRSEERLRNEQVVEERLGPFKTFKVGARGYDEMKRQALEVFDIADLISGKYMRQCKGCISFDRRHHCEGFWPDMFLDEAAAEIECLRSLITAWADAGDAVDDAYQFRHWDSLKEDWTYLEQTVVALRKAVGR